MEKRYFCEGCNIGCKYGVVHAYDQTFSDSKVRPPCIYEGPRIPCDLYNRQFRSETCFDNHKKKTLGKKNKKSACEIRRCCGTCGAMITQNTNECNKRFCATCKENK